MSPELRRLGKTNGTQTHIHSLDLTLPRESVNILCGPTLSGRTSLMQLIGACPAYGGDPSSHRSPRTDQTTPRLFCSLISGAFPEPLCCHFSILPAASVEPLACLPVKEMHGA